eukprot:GHUV01028207.1.p1 GENE.GHUV01028207.1~~GHUV01028207.1.p1  ORF type:complete len:171 (+),score=14.99 GHUV01028207.1:271-783(+)
MLTAGCRHGTTAACRYTTLRHNGPTAPTFTPSKVPAQVLITDRPTTQCCIGVASHSTTAPFVCSTPKDDSEAPPTHPATFIPERHPQDVRMLRAVDALDPLIACCAHGLWYEPRHDHDTGVDVRQARVIKTPPHLTLKGTNLVKDVHNLGAGRGSRERRKGERCLVVAYD